MQDRRGRCQRSDYTRRRRNYRRARRHLRDPRHPVHRGRRDRQLFRMSAAPSEAIMGRSRDPEAPLPDSGPQFRASDTERRTDGHLERERRLVDRSPAGPQCQGSQGIVSLRSRTDEARFLPSSGIRSRLWQREAQIRRTLRVTLPKTLRPRQRTCIS
jgi:hypothetical protein